MMKVDSYPNAPSMFGLLTFIKWKMATELPRGNEWSGKYSGETMETSGIYTAKSQGDVSMCPLVYVRIQKTTSQGSRFPGQLPWARQNTKHIFRLEHLCRSRVGSSFTEPILGRCYIQIFVEKVSWVSRYCTLKFNINIYIYFTYV